MNRLVSVFIVFVLTTASLAGEQSPVAQVKMDRGLPTLFIEGKPVSGNSYATHFHPRPDEIRKFRHAGMTLFQFYQGELDVFWKGPGQYDFSQIDSGYRNLLAQLPDVYILPRVSLNAPNWRVQSHPGEVAISQVGRIFSIQSMASDTWREEAGEALAALVTHMLQADYGRRIVGYSTYAGEEWTYPGCWWLDYTAYDFCQPMQKAFRLWLKSRYETDAQLQRAWHDDKATLDAAAVPDMEQRLHRDRQMLRLGDAGQRCVDYERFASELLATDIAHFARIIKQASGGQVISGAFYGYNVFPSMHYLDHAHQLMGHLALDQLLQSPDIDFIAAPANYRHRGPGEAWMSQDLIHSVTLHGKLFMSEDDVRSSIASDATGRAGNLWENENLLERITAWRAANGITGWLVNFNRQPCWFDTPMLMRQVRRMTFNNDALLPLRATPKAEIAVYLDPHCFSWFSPATPDGKEMFGQGYDTPRLARDFTGMSGLNWISKAAATLLTERLPHVGAPFHLYLLDDLAQPDMPDYKLNIFLAPISLTEAQKEMIRQKVLRSGKTVLWIHAAGLIDQGDVSEVSMRELTGFTPRLDGYEAYGITDKQHPLAPFKCNLIDTQHPYTRGLDAETCHEMPSLFGPIVSVEAQANVRVLGETVVDLYPFARLPFLAVRPMGDWTSVYSFVPQLPIAVLRNMARAAGVHIYDDAGDEVVAGPNLVSVHGASTGGRTIRLPETTEVYALAEATSLGRRSEIDCDLRRGETRTYLLGDAATAAKNIAFSPKISGQNEQRILDSEEPLADLSYWTLRHAAGQRVGEAGSREDRIVFSPNGCAINDRGLNPADGAELRMELKVDAPPAGVLLLRFIHPRQSWRVALSEHLTPGQWTTVRIDLRAVEPGTAMGLYRVFAEGASDVAMTLSLRNIAILRDPSGQDTLQLQPTQPRTIQDWLTLGPWDDAGKQGLDLPTPVEQHIDLTQSFAGKNGGDIHWRPLHTDTDRVELSPAISYAVACFLTHIFSPVDQDALLLVGSDDGVKIWLNDQPIWTNKTWRAVVPESDVIPVKLKQGWNKALFKVNQGSGGWGLCAQVASPAYEPLPGLRFSALRPDEKLPETFTAAEAAPATQPAPVWAAQGFDQLVADNTIAQPRAVNRDFHNPDTREITFVSGAWHLERGALVQSMGDLNRSARLLIDSAISPFALDVDFSITDGQQKMFCVFFAVRDLGSERESMVQIVCTPSRRDNVSVSRLENGVWTNVAAGQARVKLDEPNRMRVIL
ncbi:MAG: beta-galactosidase, partial [Phycisphaeraceae bacterium]|nr:beta-galactosidase [Phycisphaeraceae bacterium]